jgi:hypothetical protein
LVPARVRKPPPRMKVSRAATLFTPVLEGLNHSNVTKLSPKLASKQRKLANAQKLKMSPHPTIAYDNL